MNLWRVVVCLVAAWVLILVYLSTMVMQPSDTGDKMERQLTKAMEEILLLKKQNLELQRLTNELRDVRLVVGVGGENSAAVKLLQNKLNEANREIRQLNLQMGDKAPLNQAEGDAVAGSKILSDGPSAEHEKLRRKLYNGVTELWYFIRSELKKIKNVAKDNRQLNTKVNDLLDDAGHQERSILTDLHSLSQIDGAEDWRKKEAKDLEALVQRRFHYLQNPKDCQNAKKLICNVNKGCGFGCQIHHVAYCFILAYATERTMILQSSGWRYSSGGWEKVFMPVSDSCRNAAAKSSRGWGRKYTGNK
ncbi:alpha-(1,6)-fucosyltransferase-like [Lingula anatina]|uniref:Alpha-(1,6)-fucosyltransferase-like n=1 Tax=Lingula anatina TaxID=7574 RepID=A0A1S3HLL0_LINAN|nr:alpha-(1,6)-fucosyltransferase-like [Lingula anatina]|eukprot:XP_013386985.1 alpha-(1,6)-fucosyltransferase-like [Lingula anatina]